MDRAIRRGIERRWLYVLDNTGGSGFGADQARTPTVAC
jgi:hypothetical protein